MMKRHAVAFGGIICAMVLSSILINHTYAQSYPAKPVRIIVAGGTGTGADILARLVAQSLGELWGRSIVVANIPGAGGRIGTQAMVKASPDGYTLGVITINHMLNPAFYSDLPYDTVRDLKGVISIANSTILIVANASFAANSVGELIKLAKSKPASINYGSTGNGGIPHLSMELFGQQAGIKLTHVPYGSTSQLMIDLLAGRVSITAASGTSVLPLINSGRLKPLVVTSAQRSRFFPDVPTGAEVGLPGLVVNSWLGIAAPAHTPDTIVSKLHADISTVIKKKEFESQMVANGYELNLLSGEQMWKRLAEAIQMWTKLVKDAGIKAD